MTRRTRIWTLTVLGVALSTGTACEFDATGNGSPAPDLGCSLDFKARNLNIDLEPEWAGLQLEGTLYAYQDFRISWVYHYDGHGDVEGEFPYTTVVEITQDDEVVWEQMIDSDPVAHGESDWDDIIVAEGLPAGSYVVSVIVDPDAEVPECYGLVAALNNIVNTEITVGQPIDDIVQTAPESPRAYEGYGTDRR